MIRLFIDNLLDALLNFITKILSLFKDEQRNNILQTYSKKPFMTTCELDFYNKRIMF